MQLYHASAVIRGKHYDTRTATLIADNVYYDGNNWERGGTNTWLFRTDKGNYFIRQQSLWAGDQASLSALSRAEAAELWENLPEKHVKFTAAFPHLSVTDA